MIFFTKFRCKFYSRAGYTVFFDWKCGLYLRNNGKVVTWVWSASIWWLSPHNNHVIARTGAFWEVCCTYCIWIWIFLVYVITWIFWWFYSFQRFRFDHKLLPYIVNRNVNNTVPDRLLLKSLGNHFFSYSCVNGCPWHRCCDLCGLLHKTTKPWFFTRAPGKFTKDILKPEKIR